MHKQLVLIEDLTTIYTVSYNLHLSFQGIVSPAILPLWFLHQSVFPKTAIIFQMNISSHIYMKEGGEKFENFRSSKIIKQTKLVVTMEKINISIYIYI